MSDSPFAAYANSTLKFQVAGGSLEQDANGNWRPAKAVIEVTALLDQAKPPYSETRPGVDSDAIYLEGWAVDPMTIPSVVTPDSICEATWAGRKGRFFLELKGRSPWGYESSTGDEIRGYFKPSSFLVEGEAWTPSPSPSPTPAPNGDGKQYSAEYLAATNLSALRVVALNDAEKLIYADSSNVDHAFRVVGLLPSAVSANSAIAVLTDGAIADSSWSWTRGQRIFLGANGLLTQVPPEAGFLLQVATVSSPTVIDFEIQEPILL